MMFSAFSDTSTWPDQRTLDARLGPVGPWSATGRLLGFMLRRDRVRTTSWALGFAAFATYLTAAIPLAFASEEDLIGGSQLFVSPVGRMLIGPGHGLDAPTYARVVGNGYGLYLMLLAALMSILLVGRHTRAEEHSGRAELVRANVVGRHAPLTATLVMVVIVNAFTAAAVAAVLVGNGGFDWHGTLVVAASTALTGVTFGAVACVTAQLTASSRAASGMAGVVLGVAFVLRAGGDMVQLGGSALSWTSPLGWAQQTAPYVLDRWWPLAPMAALAGVLTVAAFTLASRRDLGGSMFAVRPGRERGSRMLGSALGLSWRLQRPAIIGWTAALMATGFVFGTYTEPMVDAVEDLPEVFVELFGDTDALVAGYLAYMVTFMAYLVTMFAVLSLIGLRNEETGGRGEPILAAPVGRVRWLGTHLVVAIVGVVVLMAVTGAATGLGVGAVTGEFGHVAEVTLAHLNQVPAVLVVLAAATLLYGWLPRAVGLVWLFVGYGFVVGSFGPMLDLPTAAYDLSPFEHPAQLPLEAFEAQPAGVLTAVALGGFVLGLIGFRRRDMRSG